MFKNENGFTAFFKAAIRDPRTVSTIFPSFKFLAKSLIDHADVSAGDSVLELGCGSGAVTRYILEQRDSLKSYTGVEIDSQLVEYLRRTFPGESFLDVSAADLQSYVPDESIDAVISALPWTLFPKELQEAITKEILRVLKPGGRFTTFLCLHSLSYPGAPRAKKIFRDHYTEFEKRETIGCNIPPANVYRGLK